MIVGSPTKLNLIPSGVMPVVYINQSDAGYDKEFLVYNGDSPYNVPAGVSATIRGKKADGYGVTEAAALTGGSNLVTVTITEQMVAAAGANLYELVFVDTDGLRIATINMVWAVKPDALGDSVISDSDLDYVSQAMDKIQGAEALKNQLDINAADIAAETAARIAADDTERTARIAADSTLQANINSEASTRANRDSTLQAQIDQLVAPTGSAPSAAEILDARVGADSVTYDTLGNAIRTQVINLDSAIDGNAVFDGTFERTSLWNGNKSDASYRVSETAIISYPFDLEIIIKSGFRIGVHFFNDGVFSHSSEWTTGYFYIPKNTQFKFVIARVTEDTSEAADIQTFRSMVTFRNVVGQNEIKRIGLQNDLVYSNEGLQTFRGRGNFQPFGLLGDGTFLVTQKYRVSNIDPITLSEDTTISVKSGFRWGYIPFANGSYGAWSGWFTAPKLMLGGTSFIVQIARVDEITSEVADVNEFLDAVTFPSKAGNNATDISALNDRAYDLETIVTDPLEMPFEQGAIYSGLDYASDTYVRTQGYIYMPAGSKITLGKYSGQLLYAFYYYNQPAAGGFIQSDPNGVTVNANTETIYTTIIDGYVRARVQRGSGTAIEPSVMSGVVTYETNQVVMAKRDISIGTLFGKYSYYDTSYDTKVADFAALFNDNSADAFLFFTDPHIFGSSGVYYKNIVDKYMSAVQQCYYQTPCSFIVCGGDWLNNGDTAEQAKYKLGAINGLTRHLFPDEYYPIVGNHDTNYLGTGDNRELQPQTIANLWNSNRGTNYYSFKTLNARYYVLDTGEENQTTMTAYRWQQLQWLAENLIANDDSHNTVMFHIYYMAGIDTSISEMANKIGLLIAAYNSRSNIDLNGRTFNFSQCSGHIDYSLVGHSHSDFNSVLGGVPVIGTINMQSGNVPSFDMIHVDYDTMTFNAVRVGTGVSRTISL